MSDPSMLPTNPPRTTSPTNERVVLTHPDAPQTALGHRGAGRTKHQRGRQACVRGRVWGGRRPGGWGPEAFGALGAQ